ncbi:MAG: monovalent cation/H+ antiporter complex subunit F [Spirochaetes bacterium]|nr:monovalent cation/H+ antiporter complex subunit F [Spirochaetota bacterium]
MDAIDTAYNTLLWICVFALSVMLFGFLIRAILGPRFTDRIIAINIICAKAIIIIVLLSHLLSDSSLIDIAIIYSMVSFLAVVVLSKCFTITMPSRKQLGVLEEKEEETR